MSNKQFDYLDGADNEQVEHEPDNIQKANAETKPNIVEIDGHKLEFDEETQEFTPPDDFDEWDTESQQKLQRKADEYVSTLAKAKKANLDINKRLREVEERERRALELEKKLTAHETDRVDAKPSNEPMKYWGVETWEDVDLLSKEEYTKGLEKKVADSVELRVSKTVEETAIRSGIIAEGYDYDVIKQFASEQQIGSVKTAFDYYKMLHPVPKAKFKRDNSPAPIEKGAGIKRKPKDTNKPLGWLDDL